MVNIADGDVIVAGDVFKIEQQTNRETGEVRHKVTIFSGDGAVVVNVKTEDLAKLRQGLPQRGDYVAWFVRNSPYNVEGNSGMSTRFLRPVLVQDLEAIANGAKLGQQAAAKAA